MLEHFLAKKPLYYDEIDYDRMPNVFARIKEQLPQPKIIHLVGTNGKGTTGRFLAGALKNRGYSVGHYTSPHIVRFNERIWIDGYDVSQEILEDAHQQLQVILTAKESSALSYFEYTTLLAMLCFKECEYVVLEAGLGGQRDATAVFDTLLTLVTPIAKDHEAFLGSSIRSIATTKLKAIKNAAILARGQQKDLYSVATQLQKERKFALYKIEEYLSSDDKKFVVQVAKELQLPDYLEQNLQLAVGALRFLDIEFCKEDFIGTKLFGRATQFRKNIVLDVGHNLLAAQALSQALQKQCYVLVYNSYKDKEYRAILQSLKHIVKRVEIIDIEGDSRVEERLQLEAALKDLGLPFRSYDRVIDEREEYLVFGSFKVVEEFLKGFDG